MTGHDPLHFFEAFVPPTATKQEHRISAAGGKARFFPSASWDAAEADLSAHFERHRPDSPAEGALVVDVTWCFPADGRADGTPHTGKPDADNLAKGLLDVMTRLGWWKDDSQVFSLHVTKIWSRVPGIRIDIEEVGPC